MAQDTTREAKRMRCPADVLGWIPWYADGGLTERERGAVEAHAAECGDCRAELDIVAGRAWSVEGIELPDADRLFGEITARIESEGRGAQATVIPISRGRALSNEDVTRLERWILDPASELADDPRGAGEARSDAAVGSVGERAGASDDSRLEGRAVAIARRRIAGPRSALWAAAAAVALLALGGLGGAFFEGLRNARSGVSGDAEDTGLAAGDAYQLATAPPAGGSSASAAAASAPTLDVVFADGVTAREIWSQLRGLGVEVVSGPTNLGVYRLRLTAAAAEGRDPTQADAAAIAARLVAADSGIAIFAEPVP